MSRSLGEIGQIGTVANDEIRTIPSLGNFAKEKVPFKNKKTQRFSNYCFWENPLSGKVTNFGCSPQYWYHEQVVFPYKVLYSPVERLACVSLTLG